MKKYLLAVIALLSVIVAGAQWKPDRLGDGYEYMTVSQPDDYSGKVVSTVIRKMSACGGNRGVLYVHGFNDYFFQSEMGDLMTDSCWNFYAVDLRKYGRSYREGQEHFQARNLNEYFADIDSALSVMQRNGIDEVVLIGHSTGGLISALFMSQHPSPLVKGLILNSPFLDWNMPRFTEKVLIPVVTCIGGKFPNIKIKQGESHAYAESLLADRHGEWRYDTTLKMVQSPPVSAGWIRAITQAQRELRNGPAIMVPILLMHSDNTVSGSVWNESHNHGDGVLDVKDISRYGRNLGPAVTEATVHGGLHDLILSGKDVRSQVYASMFRFMDSLNL